MRPIHKRILTALAISYATTCGMYCAGAGWWSLAVPLYGSWCIYDGRTRRWVGRHA